MTLVHGRSSAENAHPPRDFVQREAQLVSNPLSSQIGFWPDIAYKANACSLPPLWQNGVHQILTEPTYAHPLPALPQRN